MNVLVTGANGQLGQDVVRLFTSKGYRVQGFNRVELDVTDETQCNDVITKVKPDVIIHCAAYTAVDQAETEPDDAYLINTVGTRNIAMVAERLHSKMCYISTDYVFNGKSSVPYCEYDCTDPVTVYGKSKRAGEWFVQSLCLRWFIVRTAWLYGAAGHNFVKTMLQRGKTCHSLQVVHDQWGSPTYTYDVASFLEKLTKTEKYGIYHASNTGSCTWYQFAEAIFAEANVTMELQPCTTEQFFRPAPRPQYSVMEPLAMRINGFTPLRHWRQALQAYFDVDHVR